jgi:hypothetical protein
MESTVTQTPAVYLADITPTAEMRQAFHFPLHGSRRNGR